MRLLAYLITFIPLVTCLTPAIAQIPASEYRWGYERHKDHETLIVNPDDTVELFRTRGIGFEFPNHPVSAHLGWRGVLKQDGERLTIEYFAVVFDSTKLAQRDEWDEPVADFEERVLENAHLTRSELVADTIAGVPVLAWVGFEPHIPSCRESLRLDPSTGEPLALDWLPCELVLLPPALDSLRVAPQRGIVPCDAAGDMFLPTRPEGERLHASFLSVAQESPLCARPASSEVYRFTWLRSFHAPVIIRIEHLHGQYQLTATTLSGMGGYGPGEVATTATVDLTSEAWEQATRIIDEMSFWSEDTPDLVASLFDDGALWHIEGLRDSSFRSLERQSPMSGLLRAFGLLLLELSDLVPEESRELY